MIDLPLNKALVAVEVDCCRITTSDCSCCKCDECYFEGCCGDVSCHREDRGDGKDVIFKLVDWQGASQ